jgi:hypothetical protein
MKAARTFFLMLALVGFLFSLIVRLVGSAILGGLALVDFGSLSERSKDCQDGEHPI